MFNREEWERVATSVDQLDGQDSDSAGEDEPLASTSGSGSGTHNEFHDALRALKNAVHHANGASSEHMNVPTMSDLHNTLVMKDGRQRQKVDAAVQAKQDAANSDAATCPAGSLSQTSTFSPGQSCPPALVNGTPMLRNGRRLHRSTGSWRKGGFTLSAGSYLMRLDNTRRCDARRAAASSGSNASRQAVVARARGSLMGLSESGGTNGPNLVRKPQRRCQPLRRSPPEYCFV